MIDLSGEEKEAGLTIPWKFYLKFQMIKII